MSDPTPPERREQRPSPVIGYLLAVADDAAPPPAGWETLLDALGAHSVTIEADPPDGCWLKLRAGRRGPAQAKAIVATAIEQGYATVRLGVAPTPGVARLAAQHGTSAITNLTTAAVAAFLAPLPVEATGIDAATATRLAHVGLRTLGTIADLPRGSLPDYLGPLGPALEALARGEDRRPLVPTRPPLVLSARRDLDFALDDHTALATLVERVIAPLAATLRRRGLGATRATLGLIVASGAEIAARVALGQPLADGGRIARHLLATLPPPTDERGEESSGIVAVVVTLAAPHPPIGRQASFFDVPQGQHGEFARGVTELRRRANGTIGHLRASDLAHALPERRYQLVPLAPVEGVAED